MLKITENPNELTLRDFPIVFGSMGLALILFGGGELISICIDIFKNPQSFNAGGSLIFFRFIFSILPLVGGIYFLSTAAIITTIINSQTKMVRIEKKYLFKKEVDDYKFDEIERQLSVEINTYRNTTTYTPQIQVEYGEPVDLTSTGLTRRGKCYEVVDLANKYLEDESDKDNFKLTFLNDD